MSFPGGNPNSVNPLIPKPGTAYQWLPLENPTVTNQIKFRRALADAEAPGFGVTNAIDGNTDKGGWTPTTTPDCRNQNHWAAFECDEPFGFAGGTRLLITVHQGFDNDTKLDCHMLGCLRLSATTDAGPFSINPLSPSQRDSLALPAAQRTPDQNRALFHRYRLSDPDLAAAVTTLLIDMPMP